MVAYFCFVYLVFYAKKEVLRVKKRAFYAKSNVKNLKNSLF